MAWVCLGYKTIKGPKEIEEKASGGMLMGVFTAKISRRIFHRPTIMIKSVCRYSTVSIFGGKIVSYFFKKHICR